MSTLSRLPTDIIGYLSTFLSEHDVLTVLCTSKEVNSSFSGANYVWKHIGKKYQDYTIRNISDYRHYKLMFISPVELYNEIKQNSWAKRHYDGKSLKPRTCSEQKSDLDLEQDFRQDLQNVRGFIVSIMTRMLQAIKCREYQTKMSKSGCFYYNSGDWRCAMDLQIEFYLSRSEEQEKNLKQFLDHV